jgi:hypothetical protein
LWSGVKADTTVPIAEFGTKLSGEFLIETHVDSVTYSGPADVVFVGLPAVGIRGTVSGVGWGGGGIVARAANAHYDYNIPFVARWRKQGAAAGQSTSVKRFEAISTRGTLADPAGRTVHRGNRPRGIWESAYQSDVVNTEASLQSRINAPVCTANCM